MLMKGSGAEGSLERNIMERLDFYLTDNRPVRRDFGKRAVAYGA